LRQSLVGGKDEVMIPHMQSAYCGRNSWSVSLERIEKWYLAASCGRNTWSVSL